MRVIAIGCEYSGVSTLADNLMAWGRERGINFHGDDHFSIPDRYHLDPEAQRAMVDMLPVLKERFQRFQVVYHIRLLHHYDHIMLGGFHIEEEIYGPIYYYPGISVHATREYEIDMPGDTLLVHLQARPEVIEARMEATPHDFQIIDKGDIPMLLERFQQEYAASLIKNKFEIDTSDLQPADLLSAFLEKSFPYLSERDMLLRLNEKLGN